MIRKFALGFFAMLLIPALSTLAQNDGPPNGGPDGGGPGFNGGGPGGGGPGGPPPDPAQMWQRMQARLKERLGATNDEWAELGRRIQTIHQLQMELRPPRPDFGGPPNGPRNGVPDAQNGAPDARGGPDAGGPGAPGDAGPDNQRPPRGQMGNSPVEKAVQHLNQLLRGNDSTDDQIKAAVAQVRELRTKARADLTKAQEDLKSLVTARQEAILLAMGILE